MYSLIRPLLFKMDAEKAHLLALKSLSFLPKKMFEPLISPHPVHTLGLVFPHPVGLAAGFDKNGAHLDGLAKLGFSSIELGTITPRPQAGNPMPRLFRLPKAGAIINRMGFNNQGVEALLAQVRKTRYSGILGINIGKNKDTSLDDAANDYLYCLRRVYEIASYITINISSPNTPHLRQLQQGGYLADLLMQLSQEQKKLADKFQRHVPLVVKVSPDESDEQLKEMADIMLHHGVEGIIATNTTCSREGVSGLPHALESGGLSGKPLFDRSTHCLRLLKHTVGDAMTLIGVGGIDDANRAQDKLDAGASLVQVYTGLIYKGPRLVRDIVAGLR